MRILTYFHSPHPGGTLTMYTLKQFSSCKIASARRWYASSAATRLWAVLQYPPALPFRCSWWNRSTHSIAPRSVTQCCSCRTEFATTWKTPKIHKFSDLLFTKGDCDVFLPDPMWMQCTRVYWTFRATNLRSCLCPYCRRVRFSACPRTSDSSPPPGFPISASSVTMWRYCRDDCIGISPLRRLIHWRVRTWCASDRTILRVVEGTNTNCCWPGTVCMLLPTGQWNERMN